MKTSPHTIEDFFDNFDPFTALTTIGGEGDIVDPHGTFSSLSSGKGLSVIEGDLHELFGVPRQITLAHIQKSFVVMGFEACQEVLTNPAIYSNKIYEAQIGTTFGRSITTMDAPEHGKYRKLFQSAFTPKMLTTLRPRFENRINSLFDSFVSVGKGDLVARLALQFPFQFICDIMDLPAEHRSVFHKLAAAQTCVTFDREHGEEAGEKLGRYLSVLLRERRSVNDDSDFVTIIANAQVDGERLPEDVLLGFFRQLMNAGGDTSYHSFSNILAALLTHPDQLAAVRDDRSLIPRVIEEGIRWGAPLITVDRVAVEDTFLGGLPIEKNSILRVCISVANRDSTIWPEPHKFNIFRDQKRHFTFGYGPHVCIGQHLARMELQVALGTLLDRLVNVRLDPDMPPPVIRGLTSRSADAVHACWDV